MKSVKGHCGVTVCDTTRIALSGANIQELPEHEVKEALKNSISRMSNEQVTELIKAAEEILSMTDEEVNAERERIRAEHTQVEYTIK